MATQEFDASVELIDALTRASERWSDAFGERYRDKDLTARGEDFWREYNVMASECRRGIEIVRAHPRCEKETAPGWLDRVRSLLERQYLHEAVRAFDSIRPKVQTAYFRTMDTEEVLRVAKSFVPCELHDAAIEALDEEGLLMQVVRDAGCNGAKRHAVERLALLFPQRSTQFKALGPTPEPKRSFAERVGLDAVAVPKPKS
ncbi:MAG TPA: hypothetical protein VFC14_04280 [Burkholderiales bacterium]|nr:hypothetical protein [Burkholderiales bacterium]